MFGSQKIGFALHTFALLIFADLVGVNRTREVGVQDGISVYHTIKTVSCFYAQTPYNIPSIGHLNQLLSSPFLALLYICAGKKN